MGAAIASTPSPGIEEQLEPRVTVVNPLEISNWDAMVRAMPGATVFHSQAWCAVLAETYGHSPLFLAARKGDRMAAMLPLAELDTLFAGRRGICLPFSDACGPLIQPLEGGARNERWYKHLFKTALELGRERDWRYLELRSRTSGWEGMPPSLSFYSHRLNLRPTENELFGNFDGSVRRAIRKSELSGVSTRVATDLPAVMAFHRLHSQTRRKHGLPAQPRAFFRAIHRQLMEKGHAFVVLAEHEGRAIAAAVYFVFGEEGTFKYGASDAGRQHLRGNNAVMWHGIRHLKELGTGWLSFGRTGLSNEGLRRFKRGWNAGEEMLHYLKYEIASARAVMDVDKSEGLHNTFFRLMPNWLSERAGSLIYPQIA